MILVDPRTKAFKDKGITQIGISGSWNSDEYQVAINVPAFEFSDTQDSETGLRLTRPFHQPKP